jgi:hypothetical protein
MSGENLTRNNKLVRSTVAMSTLDVSIMGQGKPSDGIEAQETNVYVEGASTREQIMIYGCKLCNPNVDFAMSRVRGP